jgi:hypothetical protein
MSKIGKIFSSIGSIFGGKKKTAAPLPLPPVTTRADVAPDPAIAEAKKTAETLARLRRGRKQSVLTSGAGLEDDEDLIERPGARKAKLLGN